MQMEEMAKRLLSEERMQRLAELRAKHPKPLTSYSQNGQDGIFTANVERCRELFILSGWKGTAWTWYGHRIDGKYERGIPVYNLCATDWFVGAAYEVDWREQWEPDYPGYDLSYLLRQIVGKGSITIRYGDKGCVASAHVWAAEAATPEDAVCKLYCELFRQGILKRES